MGALKVRTKIAYRVEPAVIIFLKTHHPIHAFSCLRGEFRRFSGLYDGLVRAGSLVITGELCICLMLRRNRQIPCTKWRATGLQSIGSCWTQVISNNSDTLATHEW